MFGFLRQIAAFCEMKGTFSSSSDLLMGAVGNPPKRVMRSLAESLSAQPKKQAVDSNLFVEWRAGGETGVM